MKSNLTELEELAKIHPQGEWSREFEVELVMTFPSILQTIRCYEDAIEKVREMDIKDHEMPRSNEVSQKFFDGWNTSSKHWRSLRNSILSDLDKKLSEIE